MASATNAENSVKKIYLTVIKEVLQNVREAFLDEGYDEQLLQELKQLLQNKLKASRAVQQQTEVMEPPVQMQQQHQQQAKKQQIKILYD